MHTPTKPSHSQLIGTSAVMQHLNHLIDLAAKRSDIVLLQGESGTGKEVVARLLHERGRRAGQPFIPVHCSGLASSLAESELYGHAAGSYSDAKVDRLGHFESAGQGTVLLDELGDAPAAIQVRLLRVIEERKVTRVGESLPRPIHCQIIASTHHNLELDAANGLFRPDLFHRLEAVIITLPPLRERMEDVPALCDYFLGLAEARRFPFTLSTAARALLAGYSFPGNVRQLELMLEGAQMLLPEGGEIEPHHLRLGTVLQVAAPTPPVVQTEEAFWDELLAKIRARYGDLGLGEIKDHLLRAGLRLCGGNKSATAKKLGVHRSTVPGDRVGPSH